jgi:hypothetical protein
MPRSNVQPEHHSSAHTVGDDLEPRPFLRDFPPFTLEPPKLTAASLDQFLVWASQVPNADSERIRNQIRDASDDTVAALVAELGRRSIDDAGRFLLVLATVGELRHDDFVEPLTALIWSDHEMFEVEYGPGSDRPDADATSFFDGRVVIKARAAEMLSYLGSDRADEAILRIIQSHPETAVLVAAIDAHLFNHGDDEATVAQLRGLVTDDDLAYVGLPRWGREMDVDAFDEAVVAFYERNPGERPPVPEGRGRQDEHVAPRPRSRGRVS